MNGFLGLEPRATKPGKGFEIELLNTIPSLGFKCIGEFVNECCFNLLGNWLKGLLVVVVVDVCVLIVVGLNDATFGFWKKEFVENFAGLMIVDGLWVVLNFPLVKPLNGVFGLNELVVALWENTFNFLSSRFPSVNIKCNKNEQTIVFYLI